MTNKQKKNYSENQKSMELENDIITIIIVFDVVTKKIVLLDALIKQLVRRNWLFTLHIVKSHDHWTIKSYNFSLKVVFLFQR